jgi:hypothetical protein
MRYIKLQNGKPIKYTINQLFIDHPEATIYKISKLPDEQLLSNYSVYPLITTEPPHINNYETTEEGVPEFRDGEWYQTWAVRSLTQDEVKALSKSMPFLVNQKTENNRNEICKKCESFTLLKLCKECGCIMPLKSKLKDVVCPLNKW